MPVISQSARSSRQSSSSAPWTSPSGCSGCSPRKPGSARDGLRDLRVVLHRARPERVEARVHAVVHLRRGACSGARGRARATSGSAGGSPRGDAPAGPRASGTSSGGKRRSAAGPGRRPVRSSVANLVRGPAACAIGAPLIARTSFERVGERVDLVARAALGDGDEQSVPRRRRRQRHPAEEPMLERAPSRPRLPAAGAATANSLKNGASANSSSTPSIAVRRSAA